MKNLNLLVVDDDALVLQSVRMAVPGQWSTTETSDPKAISDKPFHAALVDMHLTGDTSRAEGIEVIKSLHQKQPHCEIVAMSGNLDRDLMERCLKAGASRFLSKPLSPEEIVLTLDKIEAWFLLKQASQRGSKSTRWIGQSVKSQAVQRQVASLKGERGPILISGESGTGKEVVSQLINQQEPDRPFLAVNIAAIPDNLFESELFGHVRGAFTGADQNKMGMAEAANGGDLFIDEIEALSLPLQVKLLRFLESGEVRRVGSKDTLRVDTRVILASNQDLNKMVESGDFREDLLWRISGKTIELPPLRERTEDLQELSEFFFAQDPVRRKDLSDDALEVMRDYNWPGNVRELKRVCEQLLISAPLPVIRREDVTAVIRPKSTTGDLGVIDFSKGLATLVADFETQVIAKCLDQYKDVDDVAKMLKISRSSLYKKVKDYAIDWR